ncbi:hypothetical protein [Pyrobaculum calidifontis]|uniref:hypothetical protein n=1 Tax=Pyrobaculum calidifontis TaxID=181486 RepID=UPI000AD062E2|nr:hypothetical protein [Pyrobaculum calidifontis]
MNRAFVYLLSALAISLGSLILLSLLTAPSLDPLVNARDAAISLAAISLGVAAPLLHKRFKQAES